MFFQLLSSEIFLLVILLFVVYADSLNQAGKYEVVPIKNADPVAVTSSMDSVLSLDDGRWSHHAEESCSPVVTQSMEDPFQLLNIRQPSPPPVLAQVHHDYAPIPPSKVTDPRPGPAKHSPDSATGPATYQRLYVVSLSSFV